jgi:aminopeptidase-like protein
MPAGHPYAKANEEMNTLVLELRDNDVSIADIARAAQVTHRAIARRLQTLQQSKVD